MARPILAAMMLLSMPHTPLTELGLTAADSVLYWVHMFKGMLIIDCNLHNILAEIISATILTCEIQTFRDISATLTSYGHFVGICLGKNVDSPISSQCRHLRHTSSSLA